MAQRLIVGDQPSAHAVEMAALIKNSTWDGAQRLFTAVLAAAGSPAAPEQPFRAVIDRDRKLGIPETSYVPPGTKPDKRFTLEMQEGEVFLGNGVIYSGFTVNGSIPGPTLVVDEGDVVELAAVNKGEVPHGLSVHAAYTQTSKCFGRINPGQSKTYVFRVNHSGVFMYHCAPGGHSIPMHTLLGHYGMMVVKPKTAKFKMEQIMGHKPDIEITWCNTSCSPAARMRSTGMPPT